MSQRAALFVGALLVCSLFAAPREASAQTTHRVDNATVTGDGCTGTFTTIQSAIDAAASGDTVVVCPGTYAESQVLINKSLSVVSQDSLDGTDDPADATVIDGGNATGLPSAGTVHIENPEADAGDITFSGFTVQNPGADSGGTRVGIFAKPLAPATTATISRNKINGTGDSAATDRGFYSYRTRGEIVFHDNVVTNTDGNPITIEQPLNATNVHHNNVTPLSAASGSAYFNMAPEGEDVTTLQRVADNTFNIRGITFNSSFGNAPGSARYTNVEIVNNTIAAVASGSGITLLNGDTDAGGAEGVIENPSVSGNTITGTDIAATNGVRLVGVVVNASITCNSITDMGRSVSGEANGGGSPTGTQANFNNFDSNAGGFVWTATTPVNAENNWWGSASGPTHPENPGGTGDPITDPNDQVDFQPFLTAPGACTAPSLGSVIISEFRLRGPGANAAQNEYVEIYNTANQDIVVVDASPSGGAEGWALVSTEDPTVPKFVVPAGTVIPARGHFLGVNSNGYSLSGYPALSCCQTATGDASYATDIPNGAGLALFRTANPTGFTGANQLDAVGFATSGVGFSEGTPLTPAGGITDNSQHAFIRKLASGLPQDTQNNEADFEFIATDGAVHSGRQAVLGAPGPENLSSPVKSAGEVSAALIAPTVGASQAPNRQRDFNVEPCAAQGNLFFRNTFTNNTTEEITRLRFRVRDITTLNSPGYTPGGPQADLRVRNAPAETLFVPGRGTIPVLGTQREEPPQQNQPLCGGLNTSLSDDADRAGTPLAAGASRDVVFRVGLMQGGRFRYFINVEFSTEPRTVAPPPPTTRR